MNVLMVEPGKAPYETQIGDDLQSMQAVVGGYIQAVYPYEEPVALVCRESGKLDGLPLNRALRDSDGDIYDIIAGNFFIAGLGQNDFTDLPHELAERFAERLKIAENPQVVVAQLEGDSGGVSEFPQPDDLLASRIALLQSEHSAGFGAEFQQGAGFAGEHAPERIGVQFRKFPQRELHIESFSADKFTIGEFLEVARQRHRHLRGDPERRSRSFAQPC